VEKSWWQTLAEQSARGDSIDATSFGLAHLASLVRLACTVALVRMLATELDQLGLGDLLRQGRGTSEMGGGGGRWRQPASRIRCEESIVGRVRL
jgi:hypothetical protein